MDTNNSIFLGFLANIEILSVIYLMVSFIVGVIIYRFTKNALLAGPTTNGKSENDYLRNLGLITACAACSMYMVYFTFNISMFLPLQLYPSNNPVAMEYWNGTSLIWIHWINPSEASISFMAAINTIHPIGDFYSFSYVLIPLGFAILCALDVRRLPMWLRPLSYLSVVYVALKFWSIYVRSGYEPTYRFKDYIFADLAKIDGYAFVALFAILCLSLFWMFVRAFSLMGRKRIRAV